MNLLVKELTEAYPDAKVVLTTRDPVKWHKSIQSTVGVITKWRIWNYLALISPECSAFLKMMNKCTKVMDGWSIEALNRHNEGVRKVVPKGKLLEFTLGQDGWKELCGFIDMPQPAGDFPNVNDGKTFVAIHVLLINIWTMMALKRLAVRLIPLAILGGGIWYARRLDIF